MALMGYKNVSFRFGLKVITYDVFNFLSTLLSFSFSFGYIYLYLI